VLLVFATLNATLGERFGLGASPGWYLYARAAQFADCTKFEPPPGTEVLCEDRPPSERPGTRYYLYDPEAPAPRHFGTFGNDDGLLRQWARRAIVAQPGDYLESVWDNLRAYWLPSLAPSVTYGHAWTIDQGLDPQLAWTNGLADSGFYRRPTPPGQTSSQAVGEGQLSKLLAFAEQGYQQQLTETYNPFTAHMRRAGLEFLRGWQRVVRFGGTVLSIATLLVLLGLVIGTPRSRAGVLLFGVGGLTLIIAPALTANFWARYTVPMAGPLTAAAAIAVVALWRELRTRRGPTSADAAAS
jgi:hypothetical protein